MIGNPEPGGSGRSPAASWLSAARQGARRLRTAAALRSVAVMLLTLLGAATVCFFTIRLLPGDPVDTIIGPGGRVSEATRALIRADLLLDKPVWVQYVHYLGGLIRGDLGMSYQQHRPVRELIIANLGPTLALSALALGIAALLLALGTWLGLSRLLRPWLVGLELVSVAAPTFWVALLLLGGFAVQLGWFPVAEPRGVRSLVLPALTLAIPISGFLARVLREQVERAENAPFSMSIRARGASRWRLRCRHALRHAAPALLSLSASIAGSLIGGAVLVEYIFGRQGLGRVAFEALLARDAPVVLGIVLVSACAFIVLNAIAEALTRTIDPRPAATLRSTDPVTVQPAVHGAD